MTEHIIKKCNGCGCDLSDIKPDQDGVKKCPDCGATESNNFSMVETKGTGSFSFKVRIKDASGHEIREIRQRPDIYEKTGEPVRVSLDANREPSKKPAIVHTVEVVDPLTGHATKIHEDRK